MTTNIEYMKRILKVAAMLSCAFAICSCGARGTKALLPSVSGKAGEVVVVVDKAIWDGRVGSTIKDNLASDCPFLPQPEPLYTLVNITPSTFTNLFKVHRNLMLVSVEASVSKPGIVFRNDIWARSQCVIQLSAADEEQADSLLNADMEKILSFIEQAERNRVISNAKLYEEQGIRPAVAEVFGGSPVFPSGYNIKKLTEDFAWIAYETTYVYQDIFVYSYPALGDGDEFSLDRIISRRNEVLKENVPGMFDETWMTTSDFATPEVTYMKYRGREFAQTRGFWEVHNDFMGGPFVSHSFYSPDGRTVIVLEAFVYAPRYDKRHYLRQVESLLYSFEWAKEK